GHHERRRPAAARRRAQRAVPSPDWRLHAAPQGEARHHGLGAGMRAARTDGNRELDGETRAPRPGVPEELVAVARPVDHLQDDFRGRGPAKPFLTRDPAMITRIPVFVLSLILVSLLAACAESPRLPAAGQVAAQPRAAPAAGAKAPEPVSTEYQLGPGD